MFTEVIDAETRVIFSALEMTSMLGQLLQSSIANV